MELYSANMNPGKNSSSHISRNKSDFLLLLDHRRSETVAVSPLKVNPPGHIFYVSERGRVRDKTDV